jgi:hypothetical protein
LQGLPFVGRAGQLLDRMLAAIGLDRDSAYITNMIPWRPPGNRTPAPHEIELCRPSSSATCRAGFSRRMLVMLGNMSPASRCSNTDRGILSVRGNWMEYARPEGREPRPCQHCIRPTCCATRRRSGWSWADFLSLCKRGWKHSKRVEQRLPDRACGKITGKSQLGLPVATVHGKVRFQNRNCNQVCMIRKRRIGQAALRWQGEPPCSSPSGRWRHCCFRPFSC